MINIDDSTGPRRTRRVRNRKRGRDEAIEAELASVPTLLGVNPDKVERENLAAAAVDSIYALRAQLDAARESVEMLRLALALTPNPNVKIDTASTASFRWPPHDDEEARP